RSFNAHLARLVKWNLKNSSSNALSNLAWLIIINLLPVALITAQRLFRGISSIIVLTELLSLYDRNGLPRHGPPQIQTSVKAAIRIVVKFGPLTPDDVDS